MMAESPSSNNAAEKSLRGVALGPPELDIRRLATRRRPGRRHADDDHDLSLSLNDVDPKAWLADVLARIADLPTSRLHELLPWEWSSLRQVAKPVDQQAA